MADGVLTVSLEVPLADEVRAQAEARGLSPEDFVRQAVAGELESVGDDLDWAEDLRRLDEAGPNIPLDEAFDRFKLKIAEERARTK
ncbi:MAG: hypothetical protein DCF16_03810 [Alphaproteobacteria bacterium]|nr:MAG: hypothetical protein DCF16_03810 [Alphaproteobacteria bacterium]